MPAGATGLLRSRGIKSWLLILLFVFYLASSWVLYTVTVDPLYGAFSAPTIGADSGSYFQMAGLGGAAGNAEVDQGSLVNLGGSSLGPVVVALVFRSTLGVACFNIGLFMLTIWWAGYIPGVRREVFAILLALNLQTLPTLMTLNKEVLAIAGMVAFSGYVYTRRQRGSKVKALALLLTAFVFSVAARWVQIFILFWYLAVVWKRSPLREKPRTAIVVLLVVCSIAFAAAVHILHVNLQGFVKQAEGGGLITTLYHIQEMGGYFLVAGPKILMNLAGRLSTPKFFLTDYWTTDFQGSWQNAYIGFQSNFAMLGMIAVAFWKDRFRLTRPLIHITVTYFIFTAINPFIQPRYMYPGYAILALEMARRKSSLEPVRSLPKPPRLPVRYYQEQESPRTSGKNPKFPLGA